VINVKREIAEFIAHGNAIFTDEVLFGRALCRVNATPAPAVPEKSDHVTAGSSDLNSRSSRTDIRVIREVIDGAGEGYLPPEKVGILLRAAGIETVPESVVASAEAAVRASAAMGYPVVMKVVGPVHKSDIGGVSLNIGNEEMEELPFSVKPVKKLSVSDVMALFRETYEGTPWDMTKNLMVSVTRRDESGNPVTDTVKSPIAFNWMSADMRNLVNELRPGTIERQRTIAITGCSYSHVIQCRDWLPEEVGAVAWFSFDNPGQSPRIPIFSGTMALPQSFSICGQHRYREDAAIWAFREANRLSTVNWERGRKLIEPAVADMEQKALAEMPALEERVKTLVSEGRNEEARKAVTEYTNAFAHGAMSRWQELKRELWQMFGRGF